MTSQEHTRVHVALDSSAHASGKRSYDIVIGGGVLSHIGDYIAAIAPKRRVGIVTDTHVARVYGQRVCDSLVAAGLHTSMITVEPGETSKGYKTFAEVCDGLLAGKIERGDVVMALGGGVVGDLTGFAAGVLRRGVRFVQVPTTLLAQVDSSVGGKTGINSMHGKNLVGLFHQPVLVLADTHVLDSLPKREFRAGYAEVVKYALLGDAAFFDWLATHHDAIFAGDGSERVQAIAKSCQMKADIVARDEHEHGDRALLNLGHTFGHALEAICHYDSARLVHGEGVSIGTRLAFAFSAAEGLCSSQDVDRVTAHFKAVGLPTRIQDIPGDTPDADTLLQLMYQDKKVQGGKLTFILTRGIGQAFVAKDVDPEKVRRFLNNELKASV